MRDCACSLLADEDAAACEMFSLLLADLVPELDVTGMVHAQPPSMSCGAACAPSADTRCFLELNNVVCPNL